MYAYIYIYIYIYTVGDGDDRGVSYGLDHIDVLKE
jgi:hypothetical protein